MLKRTSCNAFTHGTSMMVGGHLTLALAPNMYRDQQAVNLTHKIERHMRLQTALKANKVDIRDLLALPVTDTAHPYKLEYPWEKLYSYNPSGATAFWGKWYATKIKSFHEWNVWHYWGVGVDDMLCHKVWWGRATRTRAPQDKIVHSDRRVVKAKANKFHFQQEPKHRWCHPVDNVAWLVPYSFMVVDEWEEKWGFFAGAETEY